MIESMMRSLFHSRRGKTKLDLTAAFPLYKPNSSGSYKERARLTIQTINQLPSGLSFLAMSVGYKAAEGQSLQCVPQDQQSAENAEELKGLFDKHKSDKASIHDYHLFYGKILQNRNDIKRVFEIGLGTSYADVVSNMGADASPGASLRAFREFLPYATIYGADIDERVLFTEERIETYHLDQTNRDSFKSLCPSLPNDFDLMIDDGLHSPNANIHSLEFFLPRLKVNGWAIIEDIAISALPVWELIGAILPTRYQAAILQTKTALLFAVQRKE